MLDKNSTFARLDGFTVVILSWDHKFARVRFCGAEGKKIRRDSFMIPQSSLVKF